MFDHSSTQLFVDELVIMMSHQRQTMTVMVAWAPQVMSTQVSPSVGLTVVILVNDSQSSWIDDHTYRR
jgi:hypothetical protein